MDLTITARNLELPETVRDYIERKFQPIQRQFKDYGGPAEAKMEARREETKSAQHQIVVQFTLSVAGTLLRAEERASTVNAAVDATVQVMEHQIKKYTGRHFVNIRSRKGGGGESIRGAEAPAPAPEDDDQISTPSGRVVRVKRFAMKPITVEEAATQMELLGHEFFFFVNSETNQPSVLYRRRDGDYTVIEPAPM